MPRLADTTVRLLGQDPLAGRIPTADQLRIAEILDGAGLAYLEVSGGGCFDSAVRRGVESPWERIRALRARTKTPLGLAVRGRFLVGSRPADEDFVRRFIASAAANGIDVFRLHDPLNDVSNLRGAAEAVADAGGEFEAGLVYSPGRTGETEALLEQARELPALGAARVLLHDPTGSLQPHAAQDLVTALAEASGLPVGIYVQGAGGSALAATLSAAHAGAQLIACAIFPLALTLHRVSGEALAEAERAIELDPLSLPVKANLGDLYAGTGRFDEAIQQYRKTLEINPKYPPAHTGLGIVYFAQHKYPEAFAEWKESAADTGDPDVINRWNTVWKTFQTSGQLAAMQTLAALQIQASTYVPPSVIADIYFAAGERDRGFAWLERAYDERDDTLEGIRIDPVVAPFRSDPRYADLLRRMGLPQ